MGEGKEGEEGKNKIPKSIGEIEEDDDMKIEVKEFAATFKSMSGDLYIFFCCDKPDGDEKQLYDNLMKIKKEGSSEDIDQTHFGKDNWHLAIKIVSPGKVTSVVDSLPLELIDFKNKKIF